MRSTATHAIAPAPRSAPSQAPPRASRSASLGFANQVLQAKLEIGRSDDALEHEADRIADQVVGGQAVSGAASSPSPLAIQRLCDSCAAEDDERVQMKAESGLASPSGAQVGTAQATQAVSRPGAPLSPALRAYFEPRFGRDFSGVRVHADTPAASAAKAINARAFTLGSDIGFAPNRFAPETVEGRRLIAHELAHVVQQQSGASSVIRREREGTSEFREKVVGTPDKSGSVWSGHVVRTEVAPATATEKEAQLHFGIASVSFDEKTCSVEIPKRVKFQQAATGGTEWTCKSPPDNVAVDPLPDDQFTRIKTDYVAAANEGLNGWYTVRLAGDKCAAPCAGRDIPIRASLSEDDSIRADFTINVVNRAGRGDAGTICAQAGGLRDFAVHEGGHQVLGLGDEYAERDPRVCKANPEWCRPERVRTKDQSWMANHHDYGASDLLFHKRHFQFVPAFLNAAFPGCTASLVEMRRPTKTRFRWGLSSVGVASLGGQRSTLMSGGVGLGFSLDRMKEVEAVVGLQGTWMFNADREALLLGLRAGVEKRKASGIGLGGFVEAGYGRFSAPDPEKNFGKVGSSAPYVQAGFKASKSLLRDPSFSLDIGLEATVGTALSTTGYVGDPSASGARDDTWRQWYGVGFSFGLRH